MRSLRGQLLVAAPALEDPDFLRSVVLIAEHGEEGALGVVLNRPAEATVAEAVPDLAGLVGPDEPVFAGGPVQPGGVIVLAELADPAQAALSIDGDLGFVAAGASGEDVEVGRARAFAGHAGWGPGQLEDELEEESWLVAPFDRADAFTADPEGLWGRAVARKGGRFALLARMPLDPGLN